jgi:hypothetical protein
MDTKTATDWFALAPQSQIFSSYLLERGLPFDVFEATQSFWMMFLLETLILQYWFRLSFIDFSFPPVFRRWSPFHKTDETTPTINAC